MPDYVVECLFIIMTFSCTNVVTLSGSFKYKRIKEMKCSKDISIPKKTLRSSFF